MKGLCECGCGRKTNIATRNLKSNGWIKGEPSRFIRGHQGVKKVHYIIDRKTGCWIWQLALSIYGYGYVTINRKVMRAHRVYYEKYKGKIPRGLQIDHLCRNRACVNPKHLETVTSKENVLRGEGLAAKNAKKTHCINGHEFTKKNTNFYRRKRLCRSCRREWNKKYRHKEITQTTRLALSPST